MSTIKKVTGTDCLAYINRHIGVADRKYNVTSQLFADNYCLHHQGYDTYIHGGLVVNTLIQKIPHDINKRIVGLVTDIFNDGGEKVYFLGDESLSLTNNSGYKVSNTELHLACKCKYIYSIQALDYIKDEDIQYMPNFTQDTHLVAPTDSECKVLLGYINDNGVSEIEALDFIPQFRGTNVRNISSYHGFKYGDNDISGNVFSITTNKSNTLSVGENIANYNMTLDTEVYDNPLAICSGNIFTYVRDQWHRWLSTCPQNFNDPNDITNFSYNDGVPLNNINGCSHCYNIILTKNEQEAIDYINNGTLPSDAYLYPLNFDDLPKYQPSDNKDNDDDDGNDEPDSDNTRDVDETPIVEPYLTPSILNANNVYWINVGELNDFLLWFWYDIQQFSILDPSTWDNIFDSIEGLYANLANAVLSIRYMPIKPEWIGGLGSQEVIKIAQIQKNGLVDTIGKNKSIIRKIGEIKIQNDFNSFVDYAPYSELVLYLPYYGYVTLDIDIFTGHNLTVYGVYDIMSGTIQYFIFYDDTFMVNMYLAKMCVDIPITLQSAYDRDRTIEQNVATTLSGFMSAGAGALTGNPIGLTMGISSLNQTVSPQNSAPIKVEGITSEQGSLYAPSKCAIILKRPVTTNKGSAFSKCIGYLWCKTSKLSELSGFTICENPRIHFNGVEYVDENGNNTGIMILPLQEEIDEIYSLLEEGVIL